MRIIKALLIYTLSMAFCHVALANDALFNKGLIAYQKQDIPHAVKYWKKAAKRDNISAMYSLGLLYNQGQYIEKDLVAA